MLTRILDKQKVSVITMATKELSNIFGYLSLTLGVKLKFGAMYNCTSLAYNEQ